MTAARISESRFFISLNEFEGGDDDVDDFDADERNDDAAQAVDEQVALQNGQRADRLELHAAQRQRNQRDDDERVENDALKIALFGLCRRMMLSGAMAGKVAISIAGMMAKYFATSLAMLNVVSEPRVMSSCLPISMISMSLVGFESRSTMLPASLAACVPVFMATPTSAWASAGASLVPSPIMATMRPPACSLRMQRELVLRLGLGQEIVHAGLGGDGGGGELVVAGDHHGADAHLAQLGEAFLDAAFDDVLELNHAQHVAALGDDQRRAAGAGNVLHRVGHSLRKQAAFAVHENAHGLGRAFADAARGLAVHGGKSTPLMRVCAVNGTNCACGAAMSRPRMSNFSLASTTMLRPSGVSSASDASCAASARRSAA